MKYVRFNFTEKQGNAQAKKVKLKFRKQEKNKKKLRKTKHSFCKLIFSKKVVDITGSVWYNNKAEKIWFNFN